MSFVRSVPPKNNVSSMIIPPLPTLPKPPSRLQSKCTYVAHGVSKKEVKVSENQNVVQSSLVKVHGDLENIVGNLSTLVKRSEDLLTPVKQPHITTTVRRTSSLHLTKMELDRRKWTSSIAKPSNLHSDIVATKDQGCILHDSISDRSSECSTKIANSVPRRNSIRPSLNIEKYSGIKCALPSFTPTMPSSFKSSEKHYTPIKAKSHNSPSSNVNHVTPGDTNVREKSPWRLRFEKFLNHEEPTPILASTEPDGSTKAKILSLGKENRTPSFRPSTRRTTKFNIPS